MSDRQSDVGPVCLGFRCDSLERLDGERLVAFVLEPDHLATGIVIAHHPDEHRDRTAAGRLDGRGRRGSVEWLGRYAEPRPARVSIGRDFCDAGHLLSITGTPAFPLRPYAPAEVTRHM